MKPLEPLLPGEMRSEYLDRLERDEIMANLRTLAIALFHDGIDVDKLSKTARAELRAAMNVILAQQARAQ